MADPESIHGEFQVKSLLILRPIVAFCCHNRKSSVTVSLFIQKRILTPAQLYSEHPSACPRFTLEKINSVVHNLTRFIQEDRARDHPVHSPSPHSKHKTHRSDHSSLGIMFKNGLEHPLLHSFVIPRDRLLHT